jgi:PhzF family phenazine biosynthesis protein
MKKLNNDLIYQVDAFTNKRFKGNPAAVMIVSTMPSDEYMQNIAKEMNLSETAFVCPIEGAFRIRYFTPICEIQLAGHPTLASAHILYENGLVQHSAPIIFITNNHQLNIRKKGNQISMEFPTYTLRKIDLEPSLNTLLGFEPVELYESKYDWKIAVASTANEIEKSTPNFEKLKNNGFGHMMITAISNSETEDFVVRCFAPIMGVNEDPVTGSAHCALTPLWADKLKKTKLKSLQLSNRTGRLSLKLLRNKVEISGEAITVFEAKLRS